VTAERIIVKNSASIQEGWFRYLLAMLVAGVLAFSVYHFISSVLVIYKKGFLDLPLFVGNLENYLKNGVLYKDLLDLSQYGPTGTAYKFPPAYALPMLPFIDGSPEKSDLFIRSYWAFSIIIYLVGCAVALLQLVPMIVKKSDKVFFTGIAISFCLLYVPFYEMLFCLCFEGVIHFLIALIIFAQRKKIPILTGILMGIMGMMKIYPAGYLIYAISRNKVQIFTGFLISCVVLLLLSAVFFGVGTNLSYYSRIFPYLLGEQCTDAALAFSICGVVLSLPSVNAVAGIDATYQILGQIVISLIRNFFLLFSLYFLWRFSKIRFNSFLYEFLLVSFVVCSVLIYVPNTWARYQIVLIFPIMGIMAYYFINTAERGSNILFSIAVSASVVILIFCAIVVANGSPAFSAISSTDYWRLIGVFSMVVFMIFLRHFWKVDLRIFIIIAGVFSSIISRDFWLDFDLWYFSILKLDAVLRSGRFFRFIWLSICLSSSGMSARLFRVGMWLIILNILRVAASKSTASVTSL
jgi:hypothetical protein